MNAAAAPIFRIKDDARCPVCRTQTNAAVDIHLAPVAPEPGDYSVCLSCASILRFTRDMGLAQVTNDELFILHLDVIAELVDASCFVRANNAAVRANQN